MIELSDDEVLKETLESLKRSEPKPAKGDVIELGFMAR